MQEQAKGSFDVARTPQESLDAGDGAQIGHVRFDKRFHGALDATGVVHMLAVGTDADRYDEVVAVWYPDTGAFLRLVEHPGYVEAHAHRDAALERAVVICTAGESEPALTPPFG